jgi:thiamine-phosphate pyrophosphorylase
MANEKRLPRLYPIIDVDGFQTETNRLQAMLTFARELVAGGATLVQYRNKSGSAAQMLGDLREVRRIIGASARLIVNDRADLVLACGCDGVHLGQQDLSVEGARKILGDGAIIGLSTHSRQEIADAEKSLVDYIAVGPIFSTATKKTPEPVVGLELIRAARKATGKLLVAIGGITRANCGAVIEAGADSVAVIGDLKESPRDAVEEFGRILARVERG